MGYNTGMELILLLLALVMALTLHEFAHALMSDYLGDSTARSQGRITLNPVAHIDPFMTLALPLLLIASNSPVVFGAAKPVPFNPWAVRGGKWGVALVALAGPLTNLLLATFFALWLRLVPVGEVAAQFFVSIVSINAAFFVFNMIPFPPLDGSRILYAMAPEPIRNLMDQIERMGVMAVFILLLVAFPVISPLVGAAVNAIVNFLIPGISLF